MILSTDQSPHCPLCHTTTSGAYYQDHQREYWNCPTCDLVFIPPHQFLSASEEKAAYDYHQNSPHDSHYRGFLGRIFHPMKDRLSPGSQGLDFGSGPGPTLSVMFQEAGFAMRIYDPYYAHQPSALANSYDFITATEVVEHLHEPGKILNHLWSLLQPKGYLGVMTKLLPSVEAFPQWHYKNDPTHVCFYSVTTFQWLARQWDSGLERIGSDVMIFRKESRS